MNRHSVLLTLLAFVVASVFAAAPVVAGTAETSESYQGNLYTPTEIAEIDGFDFHFGFHTRGGAQTLTDENNNGDLSDLNPAMKQSEGDLTFQVDYEDHLELYFSASQSSRTYQDKFWGHEGYFYVTDFPEESPFSAFNPVMDAIDLKVGQFVINFGNQIQRRTLNADAQRNPLVGNHIIDPHATEVGAEFIHQGNGYGAMIGFGSGVSTEDFNDRANNSYRAKVWGDIVPGMLEGAASYYTLDHENPWPYGGNNLFASHRMGGPYGGVWGGGDAPGDLAPGSGISPDAYVLDLTYTPTNRTTIHGLYGSLEDISTDEQFLTEPKEEWNWYGATAVYDLTDKIWLAGRYSVADAQEAPYEETSTSTTGTGSYICDDPSCSSTTEITEETTSLDDSGSSDGDISRIQLGMGVNVMPNMMFKGEYVMQEASGFDEGTTYGTDLGQDPEFNGLTLEATYSF